MSRAVVHFLLIALFLGGSCRIASAQKASNDPAARRAVVHQLIAAAIKESQGISAANDKQRTYWNITEAQVSIGDVADAKETAAKITGWKDPLYQHIVAAEAKAGDIVGAKETVEKIEHESKRGESRRVIAMAQLKAGDVAGAKATAKQIVATPYDKAEAYKAIAQVQIKTGDKVAAIESLEVAAKAADAAISMRWGGLLDICLDIFAAQMKLGDAAGAKKTLLTARKLAADELDDKSGPWAYHAVFEAQAMAGDVAGAKAAAAKVSERFGRSTLKPVAYGGIASGQAKTGDVAGAKATAAAIREDSEDAGWPYSKASWVFADIASTQAAAGDIEGAKITAAQAGKNWKASAYYHIAEAQAEGGNIAGAKTTATEIDEEFGVYDKMLAHFAIANAQAKAGDTVGASQTFDLAEATIARAKDEDWKESRFYDIVHAREEAGDLAGAKVTAARIGFWSKVAELQAKGGDLAAARETLKKAVKAAVKLDDSRRDGVYFDIAKDRAKFGDLVAAKETAARIGDEHTKWRVHCLIIAAHAMAGDMAGAIDYSASLTDNPFTRCSLLCNAAKDLCDAP